MKTTILRLTACLLALCSFLLLGAVELDEQVGYQRVYAPAVDISGVGPVLVVCPYSSNAAWDNRKEIGQAIQVGLERHGFVEVIDEVLVREPGSLPLDATSYLEAARSAGAAVVLYSELRSAVSSGLRYEQRSSTIYVSESYYDYLSKSMKYRTVPKTTYTMVPINFQTWTLGLHLMALDVVTGKLYADLQIADVVRPSEVSLTPSDAVALSMIEELGSFTSLYVSPSVNDVYATWAPPKKKDKFTKEAIDAVREGNPYAAKPLFQQAIDKYPDLGYVYANMGEVLAVIGDIEGSKAMISKAIELSKDDEKAGYERSLQVLEQFYAGAPAERRAVTAPRVIQVSGDLVGFDLPPSAKNWKAGDQIQMHRPSTDQGAPPEDVGTLKILYVNGHFALGEMVRNIVGNKVKLGDTGERLKSGY